MNDKDWFKEYKEMITSMSNKKFKEYKEMHDEMCAESGVKSTPLAFMAFVEWRKRVEALFKTRRTAAANAAKI